MASDADRATRNRRKRVRKRIAPGTVVAPLRERIAARNVEARHRVGEAWQAWRPAAGSPWMFMYEIALAADFGACLASYAAQGALQHASLSNAEAVEAWDAVMAHLEKCSRAGIAFASAIRKAARRLTPEIATRRKRAGIAFAEAVETVKPALNAHYGFDALDHALRRQVTLRQDDLARVQRASSSDEEFATNVEIFARTLWNDEPFKDGGIAGALSAIRWQSTHWAQSARLGNTNRGRLPMVAIRNLDEWAETRGVGLRNVARALVAAKLSPDENEWFPNGDELEMEDVARRDGPVGRWEQRLENARAERRKTHKK